MSVPDPATLAEIGRGADNPTRRPAVFEKLKVIINELSESDLEEHGDRIRETIEEFSLYRSKRYRPLLAHLEQHHEGLREQRVAQKVWTSFSAALDSYAQEAAGLADERLEAIRDLYENAQKAYRDFTAQEPRGPFAREAERAVTDFDRRIAQRLVSPAIPHSLAWDRWTTQLLETHP